LIIHNPLLFAELDIPTVSESTQHIPRRLRHHIRVLGDLLGETITKQYGEGLVDTLERIRKLAKSRRQGEPHVKSELLGVLHGLEESELVSVTRAFNQFLQLANIAEQVQTIRGDDPSSPPGTLLERLFKKLSDAHIDSDAINEAISNLSCDLVLTAHPTQITRRTLIQKYDRIAHVLRSIRSKETDQKKHITELRRLVTELWHTDEIQLERATSQEEAIWAYAVIENAFWEAVPQIWRELDELLSEHTGINLPITYSPIRISSWMGGDRDGVANVTTEVTRDVLRLARWMASDLYLRDIERLLSHLSMSECNQEMRALVGESNKEPYRYVLRELREKLQNTRLWAENKAEDDGNLILDKESLFTPLKICYQSLQECGMGVIADGELKNTLVRLACFGVTLVDLDIRQNSEKHEQLLDELTEHLDLGSYRSWSETKRQNFLVSELENKRPLIPRSWQPTEESQQVLDTFRLIADVKAAGISSYIVSRAQQPSDILEVILLLKKCGLKIMLPVAPLFETLDDLDQAEDTLLQLFKIRWYREHIADKQQVMIDYSDSAKDTGQMAAAWAQYLAQESMIRICDKYQIELLLFHGRHGSMGRGNGQAHQASLSHPPGSVKNGMRLIEPGETIQFKYGSPDLATMNLDQLLSVAIEAMLLPPPKPDISWRDLMDNISESARHEYDNQVKNGQRFFDYFDQATPGKEITELALGNQPRRDLACQTDQQSINDLSAVQWIFAWTQKRLMLHAWLGTSKALESYSDPTSLAKRQEMINEWPFFRTQIDMLERVLAMADVEISNDYDSILVNPELHQTAHSFKDELQKLIKLINLIKNQDELLISTPEMNASLAVRNTYTDPLHFLQMELISRRRDQADNRSDVIDEALLVTIAGIAAGMRSTS
jgi:phosphoenolpyruvate carboxylase